MKECRGISNHGNEALQAPESPSGEAGSRPSLRQADSLSLATPSQAFRCDERPPVSLSHTTKRQQPLIGGLVPESDAAAPSRVDFCFMSSIFWCRLTRLKAPCL